MSTVKAINLQHPNSSNINMVLGADGSVSGGIPAGGRNKIINGDFSVWQRSISSTTLGYSTTDRWWVNNSSGTTTIAQESTIVPTNFRYAMKWTQATSSANIVGIQAFETANSVCLAGQTVVLSAYVAASASTSFTLDLGWSTSTDVAPASYSTFVTATSGSAVTVSTTAYQRIQFVYVVPSTAKSICVRVNAGSVGAGVSAYIAGVQLEIGTAATPFEFKSFAQELRDCQRYYEKGFFWYEGPANNGSQNVRSIQYIVPKRIGVTPGAGQYGNVSGANASLSSHAPEDGYDVFASGNPQQASTTGFNWRFVATGQCTIRQWWVASAEL